MKQLPLIKLDTLVSCISDEAPARYHAAQFVKGDSCVVVAGGYAGPLDKANSPRRHLRCVNIGNREDEWTVDQRRVAPVQTLAVQETHDRLVVSSSTDQAELRSLKSGELVAKVPAAGILDVASVGEDHFATANGLRGDYFVALRSAGEFAEVLRIPIPQFDDRVIPKRVLYCNKRCQLIVLCGEVSASGESRGRLFFIQVGDRSSGIVNTMLETPPYDAVVIDDESSAVVLGRTEKHEVAYRVSLESGQVTAEAVVGRKQVVSLGWSKKLRLLAVLRNNHSIAWLHSTTLEAVGNSRPLLALESGATQIRFSSQGDHCVVTSFGDYQGIGSYVVGRLNAAKPDGLS